MSLSDDCVIVYTGITWSKYKPKKLATGKNLLHGWWSMGLMYL